MQEIVNPTKPFGELVELDTGAVIAVQNVWITALDAYDVEINMFGVMCAVGNETVEIRLTIDDNVIPCVGGVALTAAGNDCTSINNYLYGVAGAPHTRFLLTAAGPDVVTDQPLSWVKGHHVIIEMRKTTAANALSELTGWGLYHKY